MKDWGDLGERIMQYREERGITQAQLAKELETTQSAIARMESGAQNLSLEMAFKVGVALGKPLIMPSAGKLSYTVEGGRKLSGIVTTKTSKNAAVALMNAALLNANTTRLKNMPRIEEVNRIAEVLESIGVDVKWDENDLVITPPKQLSLETLNEDSARRTRSILMLMGSAIHLSSDFKIPYEGGCNLGRRTVAPHLGALKRFGVSIETKGGFYQITSENLHPAEFPLAEASDTGTINALFAAARIPGTSVIKFASANYQVQDVCFYLKELGVEIEGIGTTTLTVHGKKDIDVPATYYLSEDPIETMFFLAVAATTNSSITIERCPIDFLELELLKLEEMGFQYKILNRYKAYNGMTNLVDIQTLPSELVAPSEKIEARPYPGLNIDNLPFFVPIATQAKGETMIHDWVYDGRAKHYLELEKLNADIEQLDNHRVVIKGPTKLRPAEVVCPPALRPATIILIGMLAASGTSIIRNVYPINRGYENLYERLNELGAKISVLHEI
jgi:UDP-N-acetylglucosamine 1-carboxyvinyltransferase